MNRQRVGHSRDVLKLLDHPIAPRLSPRVVDDRPTGRREVASSEPGCEPSENEVVQASAAFDAFYVKQWRFVWRSLGRLGAAEAAVEDLFQEVFLVVHKRLPAYEPAAENRELAERVWVLEIIRNVLRTHRRQQQRKGAAFNSESSDLEAMPAPTETPLGIAESSERVRLLNELLATLDEDKREVFVLVELEGMSVREAALALNKNESTARSCLTTARAELKRAYDRHRVRDEWRLR